jgi:hypothetical protein
VSYQAVSYLWIKAAFRPPYPLMRLRAALQHAPLSGMRRLIKKDQQLSWIGM